MGVRPDRRKPGRSGPSPSGRVPAGRGDGDATGLDPDRRIRADGRTHGRQRGAVVSTQRSDDRGPAVVPTDWDAQTAYRCTVCADDCINHEDTPEAQARQCRTCWTLPALEDHR